MKVQLYHKSSQISDELKQHISAACDSIPAVALAVASVNFILRLRHVVIAHDGYMEKSHHLVFMTLANVHAVFKIIFFT